MLSCRTIVIAFALLPLCRAAAVPKAITVWETLPKGYTIAASANSEDELRRKLKPQLVYYYGNYDTMLVWTGNDADGTRWFELATARLYEPNGGKGAWVIAQAEAGSPAPDGHAIGYTMPRTRVPVSKESPPVGTLRAKVASMDPALGTLYQIDVPCRDDGDINEDRAFIMHDPGHGWRFVAVCCGDGRHNWGDTDVTTTSRWFADPNKGKENPCVQIDYVAKETPKPKPSLPRPVSTYWQGTYERDTVFPADSTYYAVAGEGDTFDDLTERLAIWCIGYGYPVKAEAVARYRHKLRALNPKLDPAQMIAGTRVVMRAR